MYIDDKGFRILYRSIGQWKTGPLTPFRSRVVGVVFPLLDGCEQSKRAFLEREHV